MLYDAIIIGAGMSGLAAGIRLAHYEKRVCILERHTTIGGLNSFYRLRGRDYDVGLHAVTNFATRGTKKGPLPLLIRQLRLSWDDWDLKPQRSSRIAFPSQQLEFTNDFEAFRADVAAKFPSQIDGLNRLVAELPDYDRLPLDRADASAREYVAGYLSDPLLIEMLLCPLMFYGSAREDDMDLAQFCIMFRSLFLEGLGRPVDGIRPILKMLVRRYKELKGELRLRAGVKRIDTDGDVAVNVELDDGTQLQAKQILSSAGAVETMRLCRRADAATERNIGPLSFVETCAALDRRPRELGIEPTMVFFSAEEKFHWRKPDDFVDLRSGVLCVPNNFDFETPEDEGTIRITALADYERWAALPADEYQAAKQRWYEALAATSVDYLPDYRSHVVDLDMFTPTTVVRFTGHAAGAIYGAPQKRYDGTTPLRNVFLCGTDQGYVGIVGAIISGIAMANRHVLVDG